MTHDPLPDPFAEPDPETPPSCDCRSGCPCGKCHGYGWVEVGPGYATSVYPDPPAETLAQIPEENVAAFWATLNAQRAAAARSVYPCRYCRTPLFFRWAAGHLAGDHDPADCAECSELYGKRSARRQSRLLAGTAE